ncbi:MAG: efflux RND transporter periplasmic adaptor subunit [Nitrospirae bacterium]|nr:efflux RND transporter periplasmic adaptor subunit [Nitrospirota bacterium]
MKRHYLVGLVVAVMALVAVVYAARNGSGAKKGTPTQEAEHRGHEAANPQTAEKPKQQEVQAEPATVEIPEDKQQMIGVKTVDAAVHELKKIIRTVGRIEYDERKIATVNAKFEGWIEKLHVDFSGRYVKKGEALAEIYSPELVATQQEFINALRWADQSNNNGKSETMKTLLSKDASSLVEAARKRLKFWDISDDQIKKIEETEKPVRTLTLYSPVSGYVVQKMAVRGMRVMPGEKLFDIADLSNIWVLADIYESELPLIKQGQRAKITLSYFPGREMNSVIDYIYPTLSAETRTAKVRFTLPNPGNQLKPQMFTNVEIAISLGRKLAVPSEAVLDTGTRKVVYVDKGDGNFEPREIKTGAGVDGLTEVLDGLKAGEKIASSAIFLIDSEAQLKGVKPLASGHNH